MQGQIFGNYKLIEEIGHGGMGVVYRGEHVELGTLAAIKLIHPAYREIPGFLERFRREARAMLQLNHPNIVRVYDMGVQNNTYYLSMEYMPGGSLSDWRTACRELPIEDLDRPSAENIIRLIIQVCEGLGYAHKLGFIHRDLKPSNILLDHQNHPKISDFGLVKIVGDNIHSVAEALTFGNKQNDSDSSIAHRLTVGKQSITSTGTPIGTFDYMSPEQREEGTEVNIRSDIYSMGVVTYELLTGKMPIGRFKNPSQLNPGVTPKLDEIILRCLEIEPSERYHSVSSFMDTIIECYQEGFKKVDKSQTQKLEIPQIIIKPIKVENQHIGLPIDRSKDGRYEIFIFNSDKLIRDNKTGLIWAPDLGDSMSWNQANAYVNKLRLGGFDDWRLPTIMELRQLYDPSKPVKPNNHTDWETIYIDPIFKFSGYFAWSSEFDSPSQARYFIFYDGTDYKYSRDSNTGYDRVLVVRLQNHERLENTQLDKNQYNEYENVHIDTNKKILNINRSTDGRFEVNYIKGDKVIKDTKTGLMWTPDIGKKGLNWNETKVAVEELNHIGYGGYSDWRIPSREELEGIYDDKKRHEVFVDPDESGTTIGIDRIFDFSGEWVWCSNISGSASAWVFFFSNGSGFWDLLSDTCYCFRVLAVRN